MPQIKKGALWRTAAVVLGDWGRVPCVDVPLLCLLFFTCIILHHFALHNGRRPCAQGSPHHQPCTSRFPANECVDHELAQAVQRTEPGTPPLFLPQ